MSVVDRAAALIRAHGFADGDRLAVVLGGAGLLVTDEELEFRTILAEAERPDMQALADQAMRHVDAVNRIVEAAKAHHPITVQAYAPKCVDGGCDHDPAKECPLIDIDVCAACDDVREDRDPDGWLMPAKSCPVCVAVRALREDEK